MHSCGLYGLYILKFVFLNYSTIQQLAELRTKNVIYGGLQKNLVGTVVFSYVALSA